MLVLTRKPEESITLGDEVVITVLEIRGDKVRLGIEAPKNVAIHRTEVYESIKEASVSGGAEQSPT
jgi:carbon storage regulator